MALRETFSPRASLLRILPPRVVRFLRMVRDLTWEERWKFIALRIARPFRRVVLELPSTGGEPLRILVVCHGNIMRSPYAAGRLADLARKSGASSRWEIESAGVYAHPGRRADPRAHAAAAAHGFSLDPHLSSPLWDDVVEASHLVVLMDSHNEAVFLTRYPEHHGKVVLLGVYGRRGRHEGVDIEDPFTARPEAVDAIFARIDRAVEGLWLALRQRRKGNS